jgi:putative nucleotidyltransferase with HDIG domain
MIPSIVECKKLWEKYNVPENKRRHLKLVAEVVRFIADSVKVSERQSVNKKLLVAAALLHDIDKCVEKLPGEKHPDAAVRILREEGMEEVANLVATHPLHLIIDEKTAPKSWEEKILFLADKMVKYEIIGVDRRFKLWNAEQMDGRAEMILTQSYPKVKKLESEIFQLVELNSDSFGSNSLTK